MVNFTAKFHSEHGERGRRMRGVCEKYAVFSQRRISEAAHFKLTD